MSDNPIYIPVWIDLKLAYDSDVNYKDDDLHSSMDRFEAIRGEVNDCNFSIYIPVWIDLKSSRDQMKHFVA